jgi:methylated-DNA-[protein]-cysteine S-methyltransferase
MPSQSPNQKSTPKSGQQQMFMTPPPDLDLLKAELLHAAGREGLIDVAYTVIDSPLGRLLVASTSKGVVRIAFDNQPQDMVLEDLSASVSPRVLEAPARLDALRRELEEYFLGRRQSFDLPLDLRVGPFQAAVLRALMRVPFGSVETYGSLARRVGRPRAARAVGGALNRNPIPIVVPCHRVIGASGSLVGYAGGIERKQALLEHESLGL